MIHTDGFDDSKWQQLTIGYIPDWEAKMGYITGQAIRYEDKVLACVIPHIGRSIFDAKEKSYWKIIARTKILFDDWQEETTYEEKEMVVNREKIYRCRIKHNSGNKFKQIYWESFGGSEATDLKQLVQMNVTAPLTVDIPISYTTKFRLPAVSILKYDPIGGEQDQLMVLENFNNADASNFIVDNQSAELSNHFVFDGVMKINTDYKVAVNAPESIAGDTICETEFIDFSAYKKIEGIRGGFL